MSRRTSRRAATTAVLTAAAVIVPTTAATTGPAVPNTPAVAAPPAQDAGDSQCVDRVPGNRLYEVGYADATDHADQTQAQSVAACLQAATRNEAIDGVALVTPRRSGYSYRLNATLAIPASTTLTAQGPDSERARMYADTGLFDQLMATIAGGAHLTNVELDGARQVRNVLRATGSRIRIDRNELRDTHLQPSGRAANDHYRQVLQANGTTDIAIRDNVIAGAAWSTAHHGPAATIAAGILAWDTHGATIARNTISHTLTAGIDFTGARNITIEDNAVWWTGQGRYVPGGLTADAVTAYHQQTGPDKLHVRVLRNDIGEYANHGIHVTGRHIEIRDNTVRRGDFTGIRIDDHQAPSDCSADVWVTGNRVEHGRSRRNENAAIRIGHDHVPGSWTVESNTLPDAATPVDATVRGRTCTLPAGPAEAPNATVGARGTAAPAAEVDRPEEASAGVGGRAARDGR